MKVTITGAPPFDGAYDMDMGLPLNGRELHVIKELAGVRLGEIDDALEASDYDVLIAFAAIALTRAGKVKKTDTLKVAREVLLEAAAGEIMIEADEEQEADADDPPAVTPSEPVGTLGGNGSSESSSEASSGTGDGPPAITLAPTGTLG